MIPPEKTVFGTKYTLFFLIHENKREKKQMSYIYAEYTQQKRFWLCFLADTGMGTAYVL